MTPSARKQAQTGRVRPATGYPAGRPPEAFLVPTEHEAAAAYIKHKLVNRKGPNLVEIRDDRGIRISQRHELTPADYDARVQLPGYVGTYNRLALTENIEDDLLHWLRTQQHEVTSA